MTTSTHNSFVRTASLYAGVCDAQSPANVDGFMDELLHAAHREAQSEGFVSGQGVFLFNTMLMRRAEQGEILTWPLLYDGVYKCAVSVHGHGDAAQVAQHSTGVERVSGRLHFPSGRVIVSCLRSLGDSKTSVAPLITVTPGWYDVALTRDTTLEAKHALLDNAGDYPAEDGPDWTFELRSVASAE